MTDPPASAAVSESACCLCRERVWHFIFTFSFDAAVCVGLLLSLVTVCVDWTGGGY